MTNTPHYYALYQPYGHAVHANAPNYRIGTVHRFDSRHERTQWIEDTNRLAQRPDRAVEISAQTARQMMLQGIGAMYEPQRYGGLTLAEFRTNANTSWLYDEYVNEL